MNAYQNLYPYVAKRLNEIMNKLREDIDWNKETLERISKRKRQN